MDFQQQNTSDSFHENDLNSTLTNSNTNSQTTVNVVVQRKFCFSDWKPDVGTTLDYLSLLPVNREYSLPTEQKTTLGKIKTSSTHRHARHKAFCIGKSSNILNKDIIEGRRLRHAVNENDYKRVVELLQNGVDPCSVDNKHRSSLHIAAAKGNADIVKLLLDNSANPNQKDMVGNTALHLAACTSHVPIVTMLLRAGTDVLTADYAGRTPLQLAKSRLVMLQRTGCLNAQSKSEILQIIDMMKEYLSSTGLRSQMATLDMLCDDLEKSSVAETVDALGDLLADLDKLSLRKSSA